MYVIRDFLETLDKQKSLESVLLWGSRQVGKTTLLQQLPIKSKLYLDDLDTRKRAESDPGFTLSNVQLPCLIDEAQYAPNLFPEIKRRIDEFRSESIHTKNKIQTVYYLTGSNKIQLDDRVKESLAGRCNLYVLHGLSVKEIFQFDQNIPIKRVLLRGGFPILYTQTDLAANQFINDYIISFIEKDIALTAGVQKLEQFQTVLALLAARAGQFLSVNEVAGAAGVEQKTVQFWIDILQRNLIIKLVSPYSTNLSKRIVKMKKLYFYDVGICARLQGHTDEDLILNSPHAGSLFESLVFSEIVKTCDNFLKDWKLHVWRTRDQHEIDFILETKSGPILIESKLGIHGAKTFDLDPEAKKVFKKVLKKIVVTYGGTIQRLDSDTDQIPLQYLAKELLNTS